MPKSVSFVGGPDSVIGMDGDAPELLYEAVQIAPDGDGVIYQAGAFRTEADAQAVLAVWRAEGRTEQMAVNLVPVYSSVEQWQADR